MSSEFLTSEEVAKRLRVSANTVRSLCENGEIEAHQIGRQWRISEAALQEYLQKTLNRSREEQK